MEIEQLIKSKRAEILKIALRDGAKNIRLFGSVARGESVESSDIDILVEVGENPSPWFPGGLIADLEELLGRRIDVVTIGALHPKIRDRVLQEAVPLRSMGSFIWSASLNGTIVK
jgi:hypothetical protein